MVPTASIQIVPETDLELSNDEETLESCPWRAPHPCPDWQLLAWGMPGRVATVDA